jgi:hypothetical protein
VARPLAIVKRVFVAAVLAAALLYLGDALSVRIRGIHPHPNDPVESLTAPRILAIPENNGKISYERDIQQPNQAITCVHSLFPHSGFSPCWYAKKQLQQPVPMNLFLPAPSLLHVAFLFTHTIR